MNPLASLFLTLLVSLPAGAAASQSSAVAGCQPDWLGHRPLMAHTTLIESAYVQRPMAA